MTCPYCQRSIYGLTGLQEAIKFTKHLRSCKKYLHRKLVADGFRERPGVSLSDALRTRDQSDQ